MSKILIKSRIEREKIAKIISLSIDINEVDRSKQTINVEVGSNCMRVYINIYETSMFRQIRISKKVDVLEGNVLSYDLMSIDFYHKYYKEYNNCIKKLEEIKELLTKNNK